MSEVGDTATTEGTQDDRQRSSPGDVLREAREKRGWSVRQVANDLHLTMHYVSALECDEFDKLPGDVFVRGYMRSYALLLELEPEEVLQRYRAFSERRQARKEEAFKRYNRRRSDRNRPWVIISGIAFLGLALFLWYLNGQRDTVNDGPAAGPASAAQTAIPGRETDSTAAAEPGGSVAIAESLDRVEPTADDADAPVRVADRTLAWGGPDTLQLQLVSGGRVEVDQTGSSTGGEEELDAGEVLRVEGTAPFDLVIDQAAGANLQFNGRTIDIRGSVREDGSARLTIGM